MKSGDISHPSQVNNNDDKVYISESEFVDLVRPMIGRPITDVAKKLIEESEKRKNKKRSVYEQGRDFEYETIEFFQAAAKESNKDAVVFRRPVSHSPADVWSVSKNKLILIQCKTTLEQKPPYKDPREVEKFVEFCQRLGAEPYWASRYKLHENAYRRRLEVWTPSGWIVIDPDFSPWLKKIKRVVSSSLQST